MARPQTYKVQIGEKHIDLVISDGKLLIDGSQKELVVDHLSEHTYSVVFEGQPYKVFIESIVGNSCSVAINGIRQQVVVKNEREQLLDLYGVSDGQQSLEKEVRAPMPGLVLDLLVAEQEEISAGSGLLVLEAMKMENEIKASADGFIAKIHVKAGDAVAKGDLLVELDLSSVE